MWWARIKMPSIHQHVIKLNKTCWCFLYHSGIFEYYEQQERERRKIYKLYTKFIDWHVLKQPEDPAELTNLCDEFHITDAWIRFMRILLQFPCFFFLCIYFCVIYPSGFDDNLHNAEFMAAWNINFSFYFWGDLN